ncbi:N-formylglutamate amidohydrolase [Phyllobacterium phragmitis]|uniref:N-formylglutamate amidohydrolase n=1 Tax=Phyllobacterium phragmitis TaxID=2670329 RepID=A0A2S9IQ94_9HYPH|nr:N-formylglutamate amidohydrolase [Phyllobacterium phragmitis]PRD42697.1 N-formylglutamate amidohydrolase [Phyllobacterium phragmitis]
MVDAITAADVENPVRITNRHGKSPMLLLCDHASNHIPAGFDTLGLTHEELQRHIAWDPGAIGVAREMSRHLDAPLVESCISRLIIDCNRPLDAPDLVPGSSELTAIPGNQSLSANEIAERVALSHAPYHAAVEALIASRVAAGIAPVLIAIHTFTRVYRGRERPWHIGIIHDDDIRLAKPVIAGLQAEAGLCVGINQPYSPADRVYYTLERHARTNGLQAVMIEIRNDLVTTEEEEKQWGERLARILGETQGEI